MKTVIGVTKTMRNLVVLACICSLCMSVSLQAEEVVSFAKHADGVDVLVGNRLVAEYVHTEEPLGRPFISNVKTLDGIQVTRNYPVTKKDQQDHPHHQGIFHTFSQVNGIDYWHMKGITKHRQMTHAPNAKGNPLGFIAESVYLATDQKTPLLKEVIAYQFVVSELGLLIVVDATITAEANNVVLGSKEEGGLAVRMSSDLRVETGATMLDDQGRNGGRDIWGKQARWVDNSGKKQGQWVGVTLMTHPDNEKLYHWHARDYGLLTANPLGPLNTAPSQTLQLGDSKRFRYGVMIHSHDSPKSYQPDAAQKAYEKIAK